MNNTLSEIRSYMDYNLPIERRNEIANRIFETNEYRNFLSNYFFVDKHDFSFIEYLERRSSRVEEIEHILMDSSLESKNDEGIYRELEEIELDENEYDILQVVYEYRRLENKSDLEENEKREYRRIQKSLTYLGDKTVRKLYNPNLGTHSEMKAARLTSEYDPVCRLLQGWATYLIGQADNVYPPEEELEKNEYTVAPKKRDNFKSKKFKVTQKEGVHTQKDLFLQGQHASKFPQFLSIDKSESRKETENKMSILIHDLQVLKRELEEKKKQATFTSTHAKLYKDINEIAMEIMHSKHRFINLRMLLEPSTVIDYDQDTGYLDPSGEYKHISYNAITFADPQHVAGFITEYKYIKDFANNREYPLFYHMEIFHDLFNIVVGKLSNEEKHILEWHMLDELQASSDSDFEQTITKLYYETFGRTISPAAISKLLNKKVPEMIAQQYRDEYEEFVYTYKIKGVYHTCSQCKTPKLATKKYFGKDSRNKNGLKSICRQCIKNKK